jgi:hypothetical protein
MARVQTKLIAMQYVKQWRAAGKVDNIIIYHHQKAGIGDGVNIAVEWKCTTYALHPFDFCLANKEKNFLFFANLLSTNTWP